MFDIHTHILPHMDDGAHDEATSLLMIEKIVNCGVNELAFTPHFNYQNVLVDDFLERRNMIAKGIIEKASQDIKIILGAEVLLDRDFLKFNSQQKLCLGDSSALLVELPYYNIDQEHIINAFNHLTKLGIMPILAHIERYEEHTDFILELVKCYNCAVQINIENINGKKTKKLFKSLLKITDKIFIGSDCHNTEVRSPNWETIRPKRGNFKLFSKIINNGIINLPKKL